LKSFQGAILPLQIIQVDNSSCDVKITDEENREALATPNITASIDCYSGMITGFNVSLFPSSSRSILETLVQTILPKDEYKCMYGAQNDWNIEGFPVVILVDNGMDYRSEILKDFCKKYDIIIEFVPIRTPRYKAYIEQWFNVLKNAMKQEGIPGFIPTLRARIENPDIKPEKDATLTLPQIETWIHKWVLDEYHLSNQYEGLVYAPHLRLQHALDGTTDMLLPSPREPPTEHQEVDALNLSVLEPDTRQLKRAGITCKNLSYHTKELGELFRITGIIDVDILRDIRDVRHIWVINPYTKTPIEVGLGSGWAAALIETFGDKPIHESMWKRSLRLVRKQLKTELTPHAYKSIMSKQQRTQLIDDSKKEKKSVRKDIEKSKETTRKTSQNKLTPKAIGSAEKSVRSSNPTDQLDENDVYANYTPGGSRKDNPIKEEDDIFKTYKPKLLSTSKYPKKKMLGE
jgi:putative transposase